MSTIKNMLIPEDAQKIVIGLGYIPTSYLPLFGIHSVLAVKEDNDNTFNIQIDAKTLEILSIYLLKYIWNNNGSKIVDVKRILIGGKHHK